jgi:hypothetical protein
MKKIAIFLSLFLTLIMLQGCHGGGSSSSSTATVRLVNGTSNSLNMEVSNIVVASGIAGVTASSGVGVTAGVDPILLASNVPPNSSLQENFSFLGGTTYTMLAYTSNTLGLQVAQLTDMEAAPLSGNAMIRVVNEAASSAGNLTVYMAPQESAPTTDAQALSTASALGGQTNISTITDYFQESTGVGSSQTYHIWVTGAGLNGTGDKTDLRLDIPNIAIRDQQVLTLVLTDTVGGVLVNGLLVPQQGTVGTVTSYPNTSARVRVVADLAANGIISSATVSNSNISILGANLSSPAVGSYTLVPAGSLNLIVNGTSIACGNPTIAPDTDSTLLVSSMTTCSLLNDNNTLPSINYAKLRLVNGVSPAGSLSLNYNSQQIASNVVFGTASSAVSVNSGINTNLAVNANPPYSAPVVLQSQGVYSLFMLGAASGVIVQDR